MTQTTTSTADIVRTTQALIRNGHGELDRFNRALSELRRMNRPVSREHPLVISFIGKFKTGKSSLLNALLGAELLPTRATTATAVVTRIFRGGRTRAWFCERGARRSVSLEEAKHIILNYRVTDTAHPAEIRIEAPIPWLAPDVELRDTPGMDDSAQDGALETVALNALRDTDLCVCVFDASSMISAKERERTRQIYRRMGGSAVYAVNCTNRLNSLERVNEVDSLCAAFFGALQPAGEAPPGVGKYYLMCSAPKMIELDGFDVWLREITSPGAAQTRARLRKLAVRGRQAVKINEIRTRAGALLSALTRQAREVSATHQSLRSDALREAERAGKEKAGQIRGAAGPACETLLSLDGLRDRFEACLEGDNWQREYAEATRRKSKGFFQDHYFAICQKWRRAFQPDRAVFLDPVLDSLTFPGPHFVKIPASSGKKMGGLGIGAAIGLALGGPLGGAAGALFGRAIGGANTETVNNSVSNTLSFVQTDVLPRLRAAFADLAAQNAKKAVEDAKRAAAKKATGLEELARQLNDLTRLVEPFTK